MNADKYRTAASSKDFSAPLLLRGVFVIFASLLCLSLLKYFWLAGHAHPVADDFCYAAKSRGASLWAWSFSEWMNWNGRYASNLLMIHGPLTWSSDLLPGYRMVPVLLILSTFLSFWFFLRRAMEHALTTGQEMMGALAFLLLYLNLMPDLGEGFYWYTGAVTYQLGSILMLVHLGLLFRREQEGRQGWRRALVLLVNIVLAVVITGMDEIHMLLMVALHAGRFVLLVRKRSGHVAGLLLLGVVGAGAALMYLAPGNAVRGGMFADTHLFWRSLGMSALQAVRFVGTWVLSPALLAFSVLYIPVHRYLREHVPAFARMLQLSPWVAAALPFLLVMTSTFPAYWGTGLLGQHRTINVAYIFFIPLWFLNLSFWLERPLMRNVQGLVLPTKATISFFALALLGLNLTHNGYAANSDLFSGRAACYDRVMSQREAAVRNAVNDPEARVTFIRLEHPPHSLPNYEEDGPLRSWMVDCEARFFGAEERQVNMDAEGESESGS